MYTFIYEFIYVHMLFAFMYMCKTKKIFKTYGTKESFS